jgi:hypothetical protein
MAPMTTWMKMMLKILVFVALIAVYFAVAGAPSWQTMFGRKLAVIYGAGAVIALWVGGQPIGTLQPVSLRPIFIAVGVILMLAVFILMFTTRDFARGLQGSAPGKALQLTTAGGRGFERNNISTAPLGGCWTDE